MHVTDRAIEGREWFLKKTSRILGSTFKNKWWIQNTPMCPFEVHVPWCRSLKAPPFSVWSHRWGKEWGPGDVHPRTVWSVEGRPSPSLHWDCQAWLFCRTACPIFCGISNMLSFYFYTLKLSREISPMSQLAPYFIQNSDEYF